jgi:hypothetical protein
MSNFIDLTGKRFNRLTVIKREKPPENIKYKTKNSYWLCRCDCGNEKNISYSNLISGHTKSCGCYKNDLMLNKIRDLTGKKFGELLVIKRINNLEKRGNKRTYWLCRCDCGNEKIILKEALLSGCTTSCGCYNRKKHLKPYGIATQNKKYTAYKHSAKQRNIVFSLSKEDFLELVTGNCFYCGSEPNNITKSIYNNGDFISNGIDRIDSNKGYIEGNVVSCCSMCNLAKGTVPIDDFYNWIKKVYQYNNKKGIFI